MDPQQNPPQNSAPPTRPATPALDGPQKPLGSREIVEETVAVTNNAIEKVEGAFQELARDPKGKLKSRQSLPNFEEARKSLPPQNRPLGPSVSEARVVPRAAVRFASATAPLETQSEKKMKPEAEKKPKTAAQMWANVKPEVPPRIVVRKTKPESSQEENSSSSSARAPNRQTSQIGDSYRPDASSMSEGRRHKSRGSKSSKKKRRKSKSIERRSVESGAGVAKESPAKSRLIPASELSKRSSGFGTPSPQKGLVAERRKSFLAAAAVSNSATQPERKYFGSKVEVLSEQEKSPGIQGSTAQEPSVRSSGYTTAKEPSFASPVAERRPSFVPGGVMAVKRQQPSDPSRTDSERSQRQHQQSQRAAGPQASKTPGWVDRLAQSKGPKAPPPTSKSASQNNLPKRQVSQTGVTKTAAPLLKRRSGRSGLEIGNPPRNLGTDNVKSMTLVVGPKQVNSVSLIPDETPSEKSRRQARSTSKREMEPVSQREMPKPEAKTTSQREVSKRQEPKRIGSCPTSPMVTARSASSVSVLTARSLSPLSPPPSQRSSGFPTVLEPSQVSSGHPTALLPSEASAASARGRCPSLSPLPRKTQNSEAGVKTSGMFEARLLPRRSTSAKSLSAVGNRSKPPPVKSARGISPIPTTDNAALVKDTPNAEKDSDEIIIICNTGNGCQKVRMRLKIDCLVDVNGDSFKGKPKICEVAMNNATLFKK
ncbi:hypothetical protein L596_009633 [Steinernema carpocapsae]|uniref:Uncharacterized protein n=1 Tax=Steinernema carpocapsae TaxID=34508 RepID=A0A4U5PFW9_STECR|nr:hypothetical protein L596_009633 [Steinernema carpocapsae]